MDSRSRTPRVGVGRQFPPDFVRKTMDVVGRLADAPYTGQRLAGRRGAYRTVSVDLWFKIIYRVVSHKVVVIAIWDCRREPLDLTALVPR